MGHEYDKLSPSEQSDLYEKRYFKQLGEDFTDQGRAFRKAFDIPENQDADWIATAIEQRRGKDVGNKIIYDMVAENPEMTNLELIYELQGKKSRRCERS